MFQFVFLMSSLSPSVVVSTLFSLEYFGIEFRVVRQLFFYTNLFISALFFRRIYCLFIKKVISSILNMFPSNILITIFSVYCQVLHAIVCDLNSYVFWKPFGKVS
uniref:Uncharacterized protein n=1 Tax=Cacopsylla melanoneura TaxID=428564 RepID=A0A8D8SY43_9HEMI